MPNVQFYFIRIEYYNICIWIQVWKQIQFNMLLSMDYNT